MDQVTGLTLTLRGRCRGAGWSGWGARSAARSPNQLRNVLGRMSDNSLTCRRDLTLESPASTPVQIQSYRSVSSSRRPFSVQACSPVSVSGSTRSRTLRRGLKFVRSTGCARHHRPCRQLLKQFPPLSLERPRPRHRSVRHSVSVRTRRRPRKARRRHRLGRMQS